MFTFLSAVCLHFVSCLFTFLSFCKQTADFSAKIRFWLFWTKLTPVKRQYPFSVFVNKQLTLFTFFQLFVYNSAVCLLSQFCKQTADFSVFSCLFTFQLFVYFLSFVNKQLFVYISQQNPGFGFFVPSWPQSNASTRSQLLTAVCLHFLSFL